MKGPFTAAFWLEPGHWGNNVYPKWVVHDSTGCVKYDAYTMKERAEEVAEWWNEEYARILMTHGTKAEGL